MMYTSDVRYTSRFVKCSMPTIAFRRAVKRRLECLAGLPVLSLQIEIAIGIEIGPVDLLLFSNLVSPSTQTAEHRRHAIEFRLVLSAFPSVQRLADNENILNGSAFEGRATGDLEIPPPVRLGGLAVTFGNVKRDRLAGAQPLISCGTMDAVQTLGLLVHPRDIADG